MFTTGQDVNVVDSHTNQTEPFQVVKVTEKKVTVMDWDCEAEFMLKGDSFWNGEFYLEVA